jgi:signal recognition particle subunit SRP54
MNEGAVEKSMGRMEAMYNSMTKKERANTDLIDGPRRRRIARGAGVQPNDVGQFVKQFETARDMMRAVGGMGMMGKMRFMQQVMGGRLAGLGQMGGPGVEAEAVGVAGAEGSE